MTRRLSFATVIASFSIAGCAHHPWDPFLVPRPIVEKETNVIALTPVVFGISELHVADTLLARFDSLIAGSFRQGGFQTVPARVADSVWRRLRDSSGAFFDPRTGVEDTLREMAVEERWREALLQDFGADAFFRARIVVVAAHFSDGSAHWDGASESFQSFGTKLLSALVGVHGTGQTTALSLWVVVRNSFGKAMYLDEGGIQLLDRPTQGGFTRVATAELLTDSVRARRAVSIALGPLITRDSTVSHR